jgi:hypothetical protein
VAVDLSTCVHMCWCIVPGVQVLAVARVGGGGVAVTLLLAPLLDVHAPHTLDATLEVTWQPPSEVRPSPTSQQQNSCTDQVNKKRMSAILNKPTQNG